MSKLFTPAKKNTSFMTQPWFVIVLVFSCFAILTPKIFMPLFMQMFGINKPDAKSSLNERAPPRMRGPGPRGGPSGGGGPQPPPQHHAENPRDGFARPPSPAAYTPQTGGSQSKSLLTFLLPVYAVGIGLYMVYTLFKVFKKDEKKEEDEESDYDTSTKRQGYKFKEKEQLVESGLDWNADEAKFNYVDKEHGRFGRTEESEDELNDYERYKSVDPEYLQYLKEARRLRKEQLANKALLSKKAASLDTGEVTSGTGLTSITNTNVLMNDTLERMKYSLNKINNQLVEVERKGSPLDDPELETLKLQLTQTELQMAKIMNIVNSVSAALETQTPQDEADAAEDDDEDLVQMKYCQQAEFVENGLRNRKAKKLERSTSSESNSNHSQSNEKLKSAKATAPIQQAAVKPAKKKNKKKKKNATATLSKNEL